MQYPRHLILDTQLSKPKSSSVQSWATLYSYKTSTSAGLAANEVLAKNTSFNNVTPYGGKNLPLTDTYEQFPHHLFNINFLRKERLYTKLKYSRCPQYDIVGGGWAALFAGLLGFLISEKFGIELVDSGDFYNALMYAIFAAFSLRPLIKIIDKSFQLKDLLLVPLLIDYLLTLLTLVVKRFKA